MILLLKQVNSIIYIGDAVRLARPCVLPSRRVVGVRESATLAHTHTRELVQSNFGLFFTCPVQAADDVYVLCILYCVTVRSSRVYRRRRRRRRICQSRSHYIYNTYTYIIYYTCFILYIYYIHIDAYMGIRTSLHVSCV